MLASRVKKATYVWKKSCYLHLRTASWSSMHWDKNKKEFFDLILPPSFNPLSNIDLFDNSPKILTNFDLNLSPRKVPHQLSENLYNEVPEVKYDEIKPHDQSLYDRELEIETAQLIEARQNTVEMVESLHKIGRGASLKITRKSILNWYEQFIQELTSEIDNLKSNNSSILKGSLTPCLMLLSPEKVAFITINTIVNEILVSKNFGAVFSTVALDVANQIQAEFYITKMSKLKTWEAEQTKQKIKDSQGKPLVRSIISKRIRKLIEEDVWEETEKLKLGVILINIFVSLAKDENGNAEFLHEIRRLSKDKLRGYLSMRPETYTVLLEKSLTTGEPRYLPMVVPPCHWEIKKLNGGYWRIKSSLLKYRSASQLNVLRNSNIQPVLNGLNILGELPWRINNVVYETAAALHEKGICLGELPSIINFEYPDKSQFYKPKVVKDQSGPALLNESDINDPSDSTGTELVFDTARYNYTCKKIKNKNQELHSLRCDLKIKFQIAEKFKNDIIYFPWNLDFRGRAYPIPPNLNHMGSDLCRGMLKFANSKKLGKEGLRWLKVHLSNLAGNNKISLAERVEWTEKHLDEVFDSATNPVDGNRWWSTLECPFQALACCVEIYNAMQLENPEEFECSLPIHQDGSCNGLQHYAALGRDYVGAQSVNLTNSSKPQDVYSEVLKRVLKQIDEDANISEDIANNDQKQIGKSARLVKGFIDRKVIKQTVMTSVYGVTQLGARDQVFARLAEKFFGNQDVIVDKEKEAELRVAAGYIAKLTLNSLRGMFVSATSIMSWLGNAAELVAREGQVMSWVTPLGLPVMQPYRQVMKHSVKTVLQNVLLTVNSDALPVSAQKQRSAFPPNFVHSLDSTHMLMTALKMKERGVDFSAVHDSYWVLPADIHILNEELRNAFVELYSLPILENLRDSLQIRFPNLQFEPLPARGSLDIEEVKKSTFFFH